MKCDEEPADGDCQDVKQERIRYFTGRHMTARDFCDADAYHRSFRHLHNRILHGWGIACGLDVILHPNPDCRRDRVVVRCGLAIDCCGREIVVRKDLVPARIPWDERPKDEQEKSGAEAPARYVLLLCLKYCETLTEKAPVLYSPQACSNPAMEYGRIREGYEVCWRWVKYDDLHKYGWDTPEGCAPGAEEADVEAARVEAADVEQHPHKPEPRRPPRPCPDEPDRPACCLDTACPPHHCVPLAVLRARGREDMDALDDIDISGRRSIAHAREHLTHVCWISWPHGGLVRTSDLRHLRIRFDRPLLDAEHPGRPGPRGINERTFVVQYGEQYEDRQMEDLDFVEYRRPPYLTPDGRTAVYEIRKPLSYRSHILHVTLRCNFLLDCRRNPVDGDHLGGRLPSGDGVAGGTFESWFRVVDDEEYARVMKTEQASSGAAAQE
jgi:hypothetical protein